MQVKTAHEPLWDEAEFEASIAKAKPDVDRHSVTGHYKSLEDMPVRQELSLAQIGETETATETAVAQTMILKGFSILAKHVEKAWRPALTLAMSEVSKAEFMDKTWLVVMLLALTYGCRDAYFGSMAALLVHSIIAVAFGLWIERVVPLSTLHFITAGLFGLLTIFYANEWFEMTSFKDAYAAVDIDREAVAEDRIVGAKKKKKSSEIRGVGPAVGATHRSDEAVSRMQQQSSSLMPRLNLASVICFLAVFLAEWGDKTEVVMIRLVSELAVVPTWLGSVIGLSLMTATALAPGACLDRQRVSERTLYAVSALALAAFTGLALFEGIKARTELRD
jgi:putative Ca2+/H+ antiporter (TMEM165/GDT1 family)